MVVHRRSPSRRARYFLLVRKCLNMLFAVSKRPEMCGSHPRNLKINLSTSFRGRGRSKRRTSCKAASPWFASEMGEGGFNEKFGANGRSIEMYDHWPQLRWDTQCFRIRRHHCCALDPGRSVANIIMLHLNVKATLWQTKQLID